MPEAQTAKKREVSKEEARRVLQRLIDEVVASKSDAYLLVEDNYHIRALAETAHNNFQEEKDGKVTTNRTQMRNLAQVALSALTFGDVVNFVKSQTGRATSVGDDWRKDEFGPRLHDVLWDTVRENAKGQADSIYKKLGGQVKKRLKDDDYDKQDLERELRLRLTRAYVRHLVAHFDFLASTGEVS